MDNFIAWDATVSGHPNKACFAVLKVHEVLKVMLSIKLVDVRKVAKVLLHEAGRHITTLHLHTNF